MKWFVENYVSKEPGSRVKVLDVGSYDVNGSYRHLFHEDRYEYVGLDMEKGPNVDIVLKSPYNWEEVKTDTFDVIISGQAFEHSEFFWVTMSEMVRVLKKDGLMCIVAPFGFPEHRYPVDCYRFLSDGMVALARYVSLEILHTHTNCAPTPESSDWYSDNCADSILIAQKRYEGAVRYLDLNSYVCHPANQEELRSGLYPYAPKDKPVIYFFKKSLILLRNFKTRLWSTKVIFHHKIKV